MVDLTAKQIPSRSGLFSRQAWKAEPKFWTVNYNGHHNFPGTRSWRVLIRQLEAHFLGA
jgi:hypothetical protein